VYYEQGGGINDLSPTIFSFLNISDAKICGKNESRIRIYQ